MKYSALLAAILLAACATPGQPTQFNNTRTVSASFDETWDETISYFARNNIPIQTLEKDSGLIVAESASVPGAQLRQLADCGSAGQGLPGTARYNVFVREQSALGVTVQINATFSQVYRDIWTGQNAQSECYSKGVLEKAFLAGYQ